MTRFTRRRPSASMLVALVALFVALGGTSMAAVLVTGADVQDGSLTGRDVKDRSLGNSDVIGNSIRGNRIADASLGGSDVINESLRGRDIKDGTVGATDIDQGSLKAVPMAGGVTPKRFSVRLAPGTAEQQVLDLQGLQIYVSCPSTGLPTVRATTTVAGSNVRGSLISGNSVPTSFGASKFDPGQSVDISNGAHRGSGQIAYAQPTGGAGTTVAYGFDGGSDAATLNGCVVDGTAFGG